MRYSRLTAHEPKHDEHIDKLVEFLKNSEPCNPPIGDECYCPVCIAREEIILSQIRKIRGFCKKYKNKYVEPDELMADGILGIHKLLDDFLAGKHEDLSFTSMAWIAAKDTVMTSDLRVPNVRFPQPTKVFSWKIYRYREDYQKKYGHYPTPREYRIRVIISPR